MKTQYGLKIWHVRQSTSVPAASSSSPPAHSGSALWHEEDDFLSLGMRSVGLSSPHTAEQSPLYDPTWNTKPKNWPVHQLTWRSWIASLAGIIFQVLRVSLWSRQSHSEAETGLSLLICLSLWANQSAFCGLSKSDGSLKASSFSFGCSLIHNIYVLIPALSDLTKRTDTTEILFRSSGVCPAGELLFSGSGKLLSLRSSKSKSQVSTGASSEKASAASEGSCSTAISTLKRSGLVLPAKCLRGVVETQVFHYDTHHLHLTCCLLDVVEFLAA